MLGGADAEMPGCGLSSVPPAARVTVTVQVQWEPGPH
jgi:hypothetical protein